MTNQDERDLRLIQELERRLEDRLSPRTSTAQLTHPAIAVQSTMVRRFLATQLATIILSYPTPGVRNIRVAVEAQQEIIQAGWAALLEGLFAAALQPLRLVK